MSDGGELSGRGQASSRAEQTDSTSGVVETGVPNLDRVLGGGLQPGAMVLVVGAPGAGKTMLAQQIGFHRARQGESVLYLTGYSETHDKLVAHNGSLNSSIRAYLVAGYSSAV
jgi:predicted ATP-dependent serine protease